MEPHPPPPPLSTPITTTGPLPQPPQTAPQPYSNTSPPSRKPDSREEQPNGVKATTTTATTTTITTAITKLRLMCSYGGHIVPRPHDKSLCYVGGDTRIIVVDRHISLSELQFRLSKTLLNGNLFKLKYQLPTEDLDSLISVATDEDLENMVEEYDRLVSCENPSSKASRLRLFLFHPNFDPENSSTVESILGGSKNQDWFSTALNWNSPACKKRPSVNCLLGLDDSVHISAAKPGETLIEANGIMKRGGKAGNSTQDIHSVQDSPMLDNTTSSYGSSSSATSITVQVEEGGANPKEVVGLGIEEQFQQLNVVKKEEEPQLQQQQVAPQLQHVKPSGGSDLPSPDSVSSDISVKNPMSRQNPVVYQEQSAHIQSGNDRNFVDTTRMQMQQVHESGYVYPSHFDHQYQQLHQPQQFVPARAQYVQHHQPGTMPVYYSLYPPQQLNRPPGMIEHPYPVYLMPTRPQMPPPGKSEMAGGVYRMPAAPALQEVQSAPENGGISRIYHHPSQAVNPDYAAYRFIDPANGHVYYTQQPLAPHSATQYQTMAPPHAATLSEVPPPRLSTEKH